MLIRKEYEFSLDVPPEKIKSIEIDATYRMADINRENNIYPK